MSPRRPRTREPRRSPGAPLTLAASLVLSAGLLGPTAVAADAAEPAGPSPAPGTSQTPSPAPATTEHPALTVTSKGESNVPPGENAKAGAVVTITTTVANTGDVPLLLTESKKTLPVGGSLDFPHTVVLDEGHVRRGYVAIGGTFGASTPSGATYTSPLYGYSFPLPSAEHPAA